VRESFRCGFGVDARCRRLSGTTEQEVQVELIVGWLDSSAAAGHGALRFCSL
jgi:hypothetical protein